MTGTAELGRDAVDLDFEGRRGRESAPWPSGRRYHGLCTERADLRVFEPSCSRLAAGVSLVAARARDGVLVGRTQRPEPKEIDVFRIPLILGVFVALSGARASARQQTARRLERPDGRLLPDGADIQRTTPASRPDDRGDRFTPGASSEPAVVTGRPDGRTVPDAVDARNAVTPVVIRADGSGTTSFDWLAALIGGLTVGGLALATGGLLVLRHHGPTPAR